MAASQGLGLWGNIDGVGSPGGSDGWNSDGYSSLGEGEGVDEGDEGLSGFSSGYLPLLDYDSFVYSLDS